MPIIFGIYIIMLGIIYFDTIIKIVKSKNYYNCKKLIGLSFVICTFFIITLASTPNVSTAYDIFEYFILFIFFGVVISFYILMILGIITLILYIIMKSKKYDIKENVLTFKDKYKTIIIFGLILTFINLIVSLVPYYCNNYIRKNNALEYYENKYNVNDKIITEEKIAERSDGITIVNTMEGIIYQLESGNKIYYDRYTKKYYDNKQDKEIQGFIQNYYQETLNEIINELKKENPNSRFLDDNDTIEFNSSLIDANMWIDYLIYDNNEIYFHNYYDLKLNKKDEIIKAIFSKNEIELSYTTIQIMCDKTGNLDNIINKYLYRFEFEQSNLYLEFYDLEGNYFERYVNIDGKMEKR